MEKIVLLPLDERPCNLEFQKQLYSGSFNVVTPDYSILGEKKTACNTFEIIKFLQRECVNADGLVLSIEMLLYGGLVPSRLHHLTEVEVNERLSVIEGLKKNNPRLKIYAFNLIMRCPKYSNSDEEPDYYDECGAEIHKMGAELNKFNLQITTRAEYELQVSQLGAKIKSEYLEDYTSRRAFNVKYNLKVLELAQRGVIDFLVIPQDDSSEFGYTAIDQEIVTECIAKEELQYKVMMYPGADETALTLLARMQNALRGVTPKVFLRYMSCDAENTIPAYEDRPLGETMKYHLTAAGCVQTFSDSNADLVFVLSATRGEMKEAAQQHQKFKNYRTGRNLTECITYISDLIGSGKAVAIGDNAYANGGDLELISQLKQANLLDKVAAYAGWNTSSNTIGTALAAGVNYVLCGATPQHYNFLAARYIEDVLYCSMVRRWASENVLEKYGMNYFWIGEKCGAVTAEIRAKLDEIKVEYLGEYGKKVRIKSLTNPWKRMFEIGIETEYLVK